MITIENLQSQYFNLAARLEAPPGYVQFHRTSQDDGSAHVEVHGEDMVYVHTEKGLTRDEKKTRDPEELLYWLISDLTFQMAVEYEAQHRNPGEDARRQVFQKNLELLAVLNPAWSRQKQDEYSAILARNPFEDELEPGSS